MVGVRERVRVQKVVSSNLTAPTLKILVTFPLKVTIFFLILSIFIPILEIFGQPGLF